MLNLAKINKIEVPDNILLYLSKALNVYIKDFSDLQDSYDIRQIINYDSLLAVERINDMHKKEFNERFNIYT